MGDGGEANLEWYLDPADPEVAIMDLTLDHDGYSGSPIGAVLSFICVDKL